MADRFFEIKEVLGELYPEREQLQPFPEYLSQATYFSIQALMEDPIPSSPHT